MNNKIKYIIIGIVVVIVIVAGVSYYIAVAESHFGFPSKATMKSDTGNSYNMSKIIAGGPQTNITKAEKVYYNLSSSASIIMVQGDTNSSKIASGLYKLIIGEVDSSSGTYFKQNDSYNGFKYSIFNASFGKDAIGYKSNMIFMITFYGNYSNSTMAKVAESNMASMSSFF
ncbi:hypothetical protein [Ferroplasma sp.]|uniref:hypothetical protein n=1 Tax=Ferroplasma sp. TaxID=2591003 RepID=UPI00307F208F